MSMTKPTKYAWKDSVLCTTHKNRNNNWVNYVPCYISGPWFDEKGVHCEVRPEVQANLGWLTLPGIILCSIEKETECYTETLITYQFEYTDDTGVTGYLTKESSSSKRTKPIDYDAEAKEARRAIEERSNAFIANLNKISILDILKKASNSDIDRLISRDKEYQQKWLEVTICNLCKVSWYPVSYGSSRYTTIARALYAQLVMDAVVEMYTMAADERTIRNRARKDQYMAQLMSHKN